MDPLTGFSLASSIIAIFSCALTIGVISRDWQRRTIFAKDVFDIHSREIKVLHHVLEECKDTLANIVEIPASIEEAFRNCGQRESDLLWTLELGMKGSNAFILRNVRLPLLEKVLIRQYGMFKENVILLRTLCTELRSQQQLLDMGAGIARLVSDVLEIDDSSIDGDHLNEDVSQQPLHRQSDGGPGATTAGGFVNEGTPRTRKGKLGRHAVLNTLSQLGQSNYVVKATVAIETRQSAGGSRFIFVPAESEHIPALVKLDTGSDVDIVSQEFLEEAGFRESLLQPIPPEEGECFLTISGKKYKPESKVRLFWYMDGEQRMRQNIFYVVAGAPVDLLLGSKEFASEAAKRVALFGREPKSKAMGELERRNMEQRQLEAQDEDEKALREEIKRRLEKRSKTHISSNDARSDIELGQMSSTTRT